MGYNTIPIGLATPVIGPPSCSSLHRNAARPKSSGTIGSSKLCPATMATPIASTETGGSQTSAANAIIEQPMAQITCMKTR